MLLENKYYKLIDKHTEEGNAVFRLALVPTCDVYRGHFPGHPVCPGVCGIELIKECTMMLTGQQLRINTINKCRFTAVASPAQCPELTVTLVIAPKDNGYTVEARIVDSEKLYIEYKGNMVIA